MQLHVAMHREIQEGAYTPLTYLMHRMVEELGLVLLYTLPLSGIVWFSCELAGSWAVFWLVYFITSCNGTSASLLQFLYALVDW